MYQIKKPDVVFFDWDGTIIEIEDALHYIAKSLAEAFPIAKYKTEDFKQHVEDAFSMGVTAKDAIYYLYKDTDYDIEVILNCMRNGHMMYMPLLSIKEGVVDVIRLLHSNNIHICIVSNRDATSLNREVKELQLDQYFKHIISFEDVGVAKPMPDIIYHCINLLNDKNIEISNCWLIGDQMTDIGCAINSGAMPFFVGKKEDLTQDFIDKIDKNEVITIQRYHQLEDIINQVC